MDFYQALGNLVLASRLRRISENYISELNQVYQNQNIDFDTSWFPLFYILSKSPALSIKEISDQVSVSHSATSQLVSNLKKKGLVKTGPSQIDKRMIVVELTEEGCALLQKLLPIWESISLSMQELEDREPGASQALQSLTALEDAFEKIKLSEIIIQNLNKCK